MTRGHAGAGDATRRDQIHHGITQQQERARRLLARAGDQEFAATTARTLHHLDALHARFRDTEVAPDQDAPWLSFIHAQLAVAIWELDVAERELDAVRRARPR
jgi:hypothetical protein